jgi:hypothetical protein
MESYKMRSFGSEVFEAKTSICFYGGELIG